MQKRIGRWILGIGLTMLIFFFANRTLPMPYGEHTGKVLAVVLLLIATPSIVIGWALHFD